MGDAQVTVRSSIAPSDRSPPGQPGRGRLLLALAVFASLVLAGCIASEGRTASLSASAGSGDLVLHVELQDGQLVRSGAWWAEDAPTLAPEPPGTVEGWRAMVLKNDVVVARERLHGDASEAVMTWRSSMVGTAAQAGDVFEVLLVNTTDETEVASFEVEIQP